MHQKTKRYLGLLFPKKYLLRCLEVLEKPEPAAADIAFAGIEVVRVVVFESVGLQVAESVGVAVAASVVAQPALWGATHRKSGIFLLLRLYPHRNRGI